MKKLSVVMAALLVASGAVMAQDSGASAGGTGAGTIGGIATGTVVAGAVAAGVLAAVVSNNRSDAAPVVEEEDDATCATGFTGPVNGVCTGSTTTVTGTGTNTKTTTVAITRPAQ